MAVRWACTRKTQVRFLFPPFVSVKRTELRCEAGTELLISIKATAVMY